MELFTRSAMQSKRTCLQSVASMLLGMSVLLAGCSPNQDAQEEAANAVQIGLTSAIDHAKTTKDPVVAFTQLATSEKLILNANKLCDRRGANCKVVPQMNESLELRIKLLKQAIKEKRPEALYFLYGTAGTRGAEYEPLENVAAPFLIKYLDTVKVTSEKDAVLIYAAGDIFAQGDAVVRDSSKAASYYARAWALGQSQAANSAAKMFLAINDERNAYLWSLRCTGECKRSDPVRLEALQEALTPAAAKQAEKTAAMPSVIELETGN